MTFRPLSRGSVPFVPLPTLELITTSPAVALTVSMSSFASEGSAYPASVSEPLALPNCTPLPPPVIVRSPLISSESSITVLPVVLIWSLTNVVCPDP